MFFTSRIPLFSDSGKDSGILRFKNSLGHKLIKCRRLQNFFSLGSLFIFSDFEPPSSVCVDGAEIPLRVVREYLCVFTVKKGVLGPSVRVNASLNHGGFVDKVTLSYPSGSNSWIKERCALRRESRNRLTHYSFRRSSFLIVSGSPRPSVFLITRPTRKLNDSLLPDL